MARSSHPLPDAADASNPTSRSSEAHPLDALTGGAFSAATAGERAARVRDWLATQPSAEQMQEVFKELSSKDKGAAKLLREKLDELKRKRSQETIAAEWAQKAEALLTPDRMNIADALAWQRDAAKAGAPLSREPLATLKTQLNERVKGIEDLQHRVQVQREAAVLLSQRIEVLSTKSWKDAAAALVGLGQDVNDWQTQATGLTTQAAWPSIDARFPPMIESARTQLQVVWQAFEAALALAQAAHADATAPLPAVPLWADELRAERGEAVTPAVPTPAHAGRPKVDPAVKAEAESAVQAVLGKLEEEMAQGHGKATAGAAQAVRQAIKEHGRLIGHGLENKVNAALAAAGELEGWQRWRADQLREELVNKAEGLLKRPEGQALGGRKMQETLRELREAWKQTDQGGVPNHGLWRRFDEACNQAHKVVEAWLEKVRADAALHRTQRLALIDEVKAWTAAQPTADGGAAIDWKAQHRALQQFGDRWRDGGHVGEKIYAELQPQWKEAIRAAEHPLDVAQKASIERRRALIAESEALGATDSFRIDAVKQLQQRWQHEAQTVPVDRKLEQKLWDAFRKPIDAAFQRKSAEREKAHAALSERDRAVLDAAKALEAATASGDAQQIRAALAAVDAASRAPLPTPGEAAPAKAAETSAASPAADSAPSAEGTPTEAAADAASGDAAADAGADAAPEEEVAKPVPPKPARPVVAVRGDDRPGAKRAEAAPAAGQRGGPRAGGRPGERPGAPRRDGRDGPRNAREFNDARGPREFGGQRGGRDFEDRGPRLGDSAFRAQRDAVEHAQMALKKLAAQAHGEVLVDLLSAWEHRDAAKLPSAHDLGRGVSPAQRSAWTQAVTKPAAATSEDALLRLEMAAEVPTPAEHQNARRALQLQLLTRRHEAPPAQTWAEDLGRVLGGAHDAQQARRVQNVLKVLLRR